jgi:hypothetical protein
LADFAPTTPDTAPNAATARQSMLSPELVESAIKWVDFTLILATASVVFTLYFSFLNTAAEGASGRYILTAFVAAIFFCGGLRRVGGYTFRRMTDLRWQATRIAIVWGVTVAVLLLVAFCRQGV